MKWFDNPQTLEELKQQYKWLAMAHHPDKGGSVAEMQEINNEYDELFQLLKNTHKAASGATYTTSQENNESAADFREIINSLIRFDGLHIEICGTWLWVSGDTKPHRDELKRLKFRWSNSKMAWYYHTSPYRKRGGKTLTLDEIRDLYGSETVNQKPPLKLKIV